MSNNYRDSYNDRQQDDHRNDDPGSRWRRGEERYRREAYGAQGEDNDRYDANRNRDGGYGRSQRDDDQGGRGGYGASEPRGYGQRDGGRDGGQRDWAHRDWGQRDWAQRGSGHREYSQRDYGQRDYGQRDGSNRNEQDQGGSHWSDRENDVRSGQPYTGTYGGTGDSSYFTGNNQGSWAVGDPRVQGGSYGGGSRYGSQYGGASDYRSHGYSGGGAGYSGGGSYGRSDDDRRGFWDRASDEVASWFGDEDAARRRDEDHRGRGPKGYTRSDERIREDANDRLTEDSRVDASNITVTAKDGELTLDGTVSSREAKRRAEDVVDNISGVKHVQNNLRVQQTTGGTGSSGFTNNWATNTASTAEGGVASQSGSEAAKQLGTTGSTASSAGQLGTNTTGATDTGSSSASATGTSTTGSSGSSQSQTNKL